MNFDKRRKPKLDKLENEGGITIRPKKNTKYTVEEGKTVKIVIFQNHNSYADPKKVDLRTIQDL